MTNHVSCQTSLGKSQDFYIDYRPNKGQNVSVINTANTPSKSGDELHKQPGDTREFKLFLTSHVPRLSNTFSTKIWLFFISTIGGSEEYVLTAKTRILQEVFTCAYGWRHWRACHLSSWWWSYHTAGHGSPLPSVETTEAASLWQSYHLTDRSPGYRRSDGAKEDSETVRKVESESELAFIKMYPSYWIVTTV